MVRLRGRADGARLLPLVALVASVLVGCGQRTPATPLDAVRAYARALDDGRAEDAWALLSADARADYPLPAFEQLLREHPTQARALADRIAGATGPTLVTARVTSAGGDSLSLRLEDGEWKLDAATIDVYSQDTPLLAAWAFVRAVRDERWDVLHQLAPERERGSQTPDDIRASFEGEARAELQRLVEGLEAGLPSAQVEQRGDRATITHGTGGTIQLVLEGGAWRIEDLQ